VTTPLAGLRVLECATGIAGPYAGKLLADAGAEVLKIEHPVGGDPMRRWTACGTVLPEAQDGVLFRFLNTSKRSMALDWTTAAGHARLLEFAAAADVVLDGVGLDWTAIAAASPHTAVVSISWFGRTGPWAARAATEFTLQAWAGSTGSRGTADRPPLAAQGRLGEWLGGGYAAIGALAAVAGARDTGHGQHVDLSLLEAVHLSMAPFTTLVASFRGAGATASRTTELPSIEAAADGWVGFCTITNQQWRDFLVLIERGDLVDDADLAQYLTRDQRRDEVVTMIRAWTRRHTVAEILERATALRIPVAPIGNGETILAFEHFRERGVFVPHPEGGLLQPRTPYRLGRGTLRPLTGAPRLGEHPEMAGWQPRAPVRDPVRPGPPFAGLRVLDLTMFWAGPFVGHFLATLGADVVKVESVQRPDGIRFASSQQPAAERWWEWSAMFHGVNVGKRAVTLDLADPRGLALLKDLARRVDVLIENFSPRVLDNLGVRYEELAQVNPGLVMVRMPAFGLDGPWRDRVGFAQTMEQVSGLAWVTGYPDGPPVIPRGPCDPLAGMHAAFALLVALEHRRQTGMGQLVESTMVEAALNATADQVLEWQAYGRLLGRDGNHAPDACPQNLFACRGEEQWLALAVETDAQWRALVELVGAPGWAGDASLATLAGRRAAQGRLDAELASWCAAQDRDAVVERLLARDIPAAPVLAPHEAAANPQLRARGFFEAVEHPVTGSHELPGLPMRFSALAGRWYQRPAPTLGQHNDEVLRELLGLADETIAGLRAAGVIGERPAGL
jgi:crotonobetainyl-CoA:carnitine CoA-transferase CaiB-like acyl-CoA transferase